MLQSRAGPVGFMSLQSVKVESPGRHVPWLLPALGCGCQQAQGKRAEGGTEGLMCRDLEDTLMHPGAVSLRRGRLARLPPRHTPVCVFPPPSRADPAAHSWAANRTAGLI